MSFAYFITGGTGTIGVALSENLDKDENVQYIGIFSRSEYLQAQHRAKFSYSKKFSYYLGDVCDYQAVSVHLKNFIRKTAGCTLVVINAAALKHVGVCEVNPAIAFRTNLGGLENVANALREHKPQHCCPTLLQISSDKAVDPINVYGFTKRSAELFLREFSAPKDIKCKVVRYGNVWGSRGSIGDLWKTRPPAFVYDATRYWLSKEKAVGLIKLHANRTVKHSEPFFYVGISNLKAADISTVAAALGYEIPVKGSPPFPEKQHESLYGDCDEKYNVFFEYPYIPCEVITGERSSKIAVKYTVEEFRKEFIDGN